MAAAAAALAFLGAGCGSGDGRVSDTTGERLAASSDEVAARLEAGDACAAKRAAVALRRDAQRLIASDDVRGETAAELRSRTNSLVKAITCVPPPPPALPAAAPPTNGDDEDEDDREDEGDDD